MAALVERMVKNGGLKTPHAICLVWSLWDYDLARQYMAAVQQLWGLYPRCDIGVVKSKEHAFEMCKSHYGLDGSMSNRTHDDGFNCLSMAEIASCVSTLERGFFAGLMAFHPGKLHSGPPRNYMIVQLAEKLDETSELVRALDRLQSLCNEFDSEYVETKSPNLAEKLQSLRLCRISPADWAKQTSRLRCFDTDFLEDWRPEERLHAELAQIWGTDTTE